MKLYIDRLQLKIYSQHESLVHGFFFFEILIPYRSFNSCIAVSLSLYFWILPLAVLGKKSEVEMKKMYFGTIESCLG